MIHRLRLAVLIGGLWLAACANPGNPPSSALEAPASHWVASWGTAQQIPEPHNALPAEQFRDASLRQIVRLSLGGETLRVRISNAFGTAPLQISNASVAKALAPGRADVDAASLQPLRFGGKAGVIIPAGAEYSSDVLSLAHAPLTDLAVTLHLPLAPEQQTGHPGSRTTSFVRQGNHVLTASWPAVHKVVRWYNLSAVEVRAARGVGAVVALGDSITDGNGSTTDGNDRWTDFLATRLVADSARSGAPALAVINAGVGGGRLLKDGLGPNLVARFERDVLLRPGRTHAIVLIGVNDIGVLHRNKDDSPERRSALIEEMKEGYRQIVRRAHAHGVCVLGGTILPFMGSTWYQPSADTEADRQTINQWIRNAGVFDTVIDFDAAVRDPARPQHLHPAFDSGDHLHLSPKGYSAMADALPLSALRHCKLR